MTINDMISTTGEWLKGSGPAGEIVISSRVRLARNLARVPFPLSANEEQKAEVDLSARAALERTSLAPRLTTLDMERLSGLERRFLVERHLVSREHEETEGRRCVAVCDDESIAVMVNEEDHLRLQALKSGLQLEAAYEAVDALDGELGAILQYAFDEQLGYLTACPTNVGTGLRASVMLHLPGLVITREIEKAFRAISKLNLAVRGLYGEGTEAHGDFYQISNQVTIGKSEQEILGDLQSLIDRVVAYEAHARKELLGKRQVKLEDRVWRSYAVLANARIMNSEEAMRHLSNVRLGVHLGLLGDVEPRSLNEMFIFSQPAHLQKLEGRELMAADRDIVRATMIRRRMPAGDRN